VQQENNMSDKQNKNIPASNVENSGYMNIEQSELNCSIINIEKFPIYKEKLKSYISEIPLTAFSKEGVRYLDNSFVSIPCNVFVNEYTIKNKSITSIVFSENFTNVKQVEKDRIKNNIETEIKQNKDFQYPTLIERPIILSLPSNDGSKGEWQIDTIQIVKSLNKFVLTGQAGSGKTIIARRFALELIEEKMFFPIYVQLKDYFLQYSTITLDDISSYVSTKYELNKAELDELITCHKSHIYYILDGIDEIYNPTTASNTICQRLNYFVKGQENIILTSREGYSGLKELKSFPIVKIEKIKDKHIRELFFRYCEDDNVEVKFEDFKNKLNQIPQELRDRPLFIVLLTILFEKDGKIPDNKISIYEEFINFLMFQYKSDFEGVKSINGFVENRKVDLIYVLEEIAYKTLIEGDLNNNAINSILNNRGFDKTLHDIITKYLLSVAGILENKSGGFGFVHRSFCEYLSAKKICRDLQKSDELYSIIESKIDILKEPLLFVGDILRINNQMSMLRDFLTTLAGKDISPNWTLWLVSKLYQQKDYDINPILKSHLKSTIEKHLYFKNILPPKEQSDIVRMLGLLGDNRIGISVDENDIPNIKWCKIDKGKFNFGLSESQKEILIKKNVSNSDRDLTGHELELAEYSISRYPITIRQYSSFLKEEYLNSVWWNYSEESKEWFDNNSKNRQGELIDKYKLYHGNFPANYINWFEAKAFCKWFGNRTKLKIDLPTIQQWEKAIKSNGDFIFLWGNEYKKELCNTIESDINDICPVGCFNEVENAPLDMCGNIWEWCLNMEDGKKMVRGGSFCNHSYNIVRSTFNGRDVPDLSVERQGFRIVRNIGEDSSNFIRNIHAKKAKCQNIINNVDSVTIIDHKRNNGKKITNESVVSLKYCVAYSETDIKEEKNLIQNMTILEVITTRNNLNIFIYSILCQLNETDTIIVKINANDYAKGINYNGLFNLSKDLFFEFHIISVC